MEHPALRKMKTICELVEIVLKDRKEGSHTSSCGPPTKVPQPLEDNGYPADLIEFYTLCSGLYYLPKDPYRYRLVRPDEFIRADYSDHLWHASHRKDLLKNGIAKDQYIIATLDEVGATIVIDLSQRFLGRCYRVYYDTFGTPQAPIIATSFTDLLNLLILEAFEFDEELKCYGYFGDANLLPERVSHEVLYETRWQNFPKPWEIDSFWADLKRQQDKA
ncbi:hypothetical protein [Prosthecobacter dejongeii]|uniref:SMI1 / KNR4 family (SUKH-1) n=1 Tax=Prosthecobacter dejongeii TaxID=48465 RepID=A0A7W8DSL6_9BACT|nr:hypothetical protein [Prosthecobacter dejongeii]MBB5039951.1 hypothetical protein [Prosthecobacter dejongeii]